MTIEVPGVEKRGETCGAISPPVTRSECSGYANRFFETVAVKFWRWAQSAFGSAGDPSLRLQNGSAPDDSPAPFEMVNALPG